MKKIFLLLLLFSKISFAQTLPIVSTHNYGTLESVSKLQSDFRFVNRGNKTVFVLIVNGGENISYQKPTGIQPGDTGILQINYEPVTAGGFNESIKVYLSDSNKPVELKMTGNIKHIDNAMLHCARFNEPNSYQPTAPLITFTTKEKPPDVPIDDIIVLRPLEKSDSIILSVTPPIAFDTVAVPPQPIDSVSTPEFPVSEFSANNIVFVVDVSSSMLKDDKIELLKKSLEKLLSQTRGIDKVSIVSFSNGAELILPPNNGSNHELMDSIIQSLEARGTTNISAGFDLGVSTLLQNYISSGNNQIFILTDGGFDMPEKSLEKLNEDTRQKNFTIVGIGKDNESQKILQKLSSKLNAGYVKIKNTSQQNALLEEVKMRSKL